MWFGFRIPSPLHLSTFQIPIQNLKCPKNAKNAWLFNMQEEEGWISGSARLCLRLQILLTGLAAMFLLLNMIHIWGMVTIGEQVCSFTTLFMLWGINCWCKDDTDQRRHSLGFTLDRWRESPAFLGDLQFWMGIWNVLRWNGLEILIPKHMWKSIIGPLEQI